MSCGCPRPEDIEIIVAFIKEIGDTEIRHREECEREREHIKSSGRDESENRLRIVKARVEHKIRCRIEKLEEYGRFIERFPNLRDAACRYL